MKDISMSTGNPYEPSESQGAYPPTTPEKSGAVTAVAVVNFIVGALQLLCGGCIMLAGGAMGAMGAQMMNDPEFQGQLNPEQAEAMNQLGGAGAMGGILAIIGLIGVIFGIVAIVAGFGVMQRRNWGRVLTLVLGGFAVVLALLNIFAMVQNPGAMAQQIPNLLVNAAYAALVFSILLNSRYAAEFH
jgi:uncharacterized membrane protein (DUF2068 family)